MLDKQDLQAIKELIDTSITASEERMTAKIDASEERMTAKIDASIAASEERMTAKIDASIAASEERMTAKIDASENRILAYIETAVIPNFQLLAEGHQTLLETLAPKSRVDNLEDDVVFLKSVVKSLMQEVSELKKAQ